jgi:hypothetical protein
MPGAAAQPSIRISSNITPHPIGMNYATSNLKSRTAYDYEAERMGRLA